jgi:hypothetical protein
MAKIKFSAQEDWTVTDLQIFFHQLNILYNRLYVVNDLNQNSSANLTNILNTSLSRVPEHDQLVVDYLEIHSPLKLSLEGTDKIIGQLRGLFKDFIYDNELDKKEKEQKIEQRYKEQQLEISHQEKLNEIEIADKHADLIQKQIDIMKGVGYSNEEIQNNIKKLTDPVKKVSSIMYGKSAEILDDKNT